MVGWMDGWMDGWNDRQTDSMKARSEHRNAYYKPAVQRLSDLQPSKVSENGLH